MAFIGKTDGGEELENIDYNCSVGLFCVRVVLDKIPANVLGKLKQLSIM